MSLFKQLWIAITFLLVLVFGGSFVVNSISAKRYLEQQLYMKNSDNANALALSLTQQDADPVLLELTLAAQFDTGHYSMIELVGPEGTVIVRKEDNQTITDAPGWFMTLLPIEVEPGRADIQKGWQQVGTLTLRSHSRFAYKELWDSTQLLALVFLIAMVLAGLLGNYLLRIILRPLDDVVTQAEAIGDRRFITIEEPYTLEFRKVVAAMNNLSARIQKVLREESRRLENWQRQAHIDKVTGLTNREPFMQSLEAALESDDVNATGTLSLMRISALAQLNQIYGRRAIDGLLSDIGKTLNGIVASHSRWAASRLNGSDFALLAPRAVDPMATAREMQDAIEEIMVRRGMDAEVTLPVATTVYVAGERVGEIMTRLDAALLTAEKEGDAGITTAYKGDVQMLPMREQMERWRNIFNASFASDNFNLAEFPVVDMSGNLIHLESPAKLRYEGETYTAGAFLPWINRLEMSLELDRHVVDLALRLIAVRNKPICVNLSVAAVVEKGFPAWLSQQLAANTELARMLWMEVPEAMAFRHLPNFKLLCERAKMYGAKMGIEHVGHQLSELGQLHDVGLDYLKVDSTFVRDVDTNVANQTLLRTLCTVGHSIGVKVIAEGVRSENERELLKEVGIDGITGPLLRSD